jgi:hypothetical protein
MEYSRPCPQNKILTDTKLNIYKSRRLVVCNASIGVSINSTLCNIRAHNEVRLQPDLSNTLKGTQ